MNFGLLDTDIKRIREVFDLYPEVQRVVLYGSRAKGSYKPASDIDLTLIGTELNLTIQQKIERQLDDLMLPYKFDISLYTHISNHDLLEHIARVGKPFFTKDKIDDSKIGVS
jgi:predicted nucleotidyltransferase